MPKAKQLKIYNNRDLAMVALRVRYADFVGDCLKVANALVQLDVDYRTVSSMLTPVAKQMASVVDAIEMLTRPSQTTETKQQRRQRSPRKKKERTDGPE